MKKIILASLLAVSLYSDACVNSGNLFLKYDKRVTTAQSVGAKPNGVNVRLAMQYGIDMLADCDGKLPKNQLGFVKREVIKLKGML